VVGATSPAEPEEFGTEPPPVSAAPRGHTGRERLVEILEASLLALVALLAAWSGYASAKWSTESRLLLARASTARTQASQAATQAAETTNFDASTFEAWFAAYVAGNEEAMAVAARRFRPEFRVAFDAWQATNPATNPAAPPGLVGVSRHFPLLHLRYGLIGIAVVIPLVAGTLLVVAPKPPL
jgi:hypothetical protein